MLVYRKREVERSYFARPEDMPRLLHALLLRRGVTSASEARAFLSPGEETLRDPLLLSDMGRAVSRLRAALEEQGFSSKEIAPEQLLQPVGALAGLGGKAAPLYSGEAPDAQLLLMSNFTSPQLNAVLDALREAGVHVPLKAVVTKHNKTWSVLALLEELQREREATRRFENAPPQGRQQEGEI